MFQETYRAMNDALTPTPALAAETLSELDHHPRRSAKPFRRAIAIAAAAALLLSTTALAAQTESGYQLLYAVSPAAAQFFQPVEQSCTANGVTMEVVAVSVEGDTAQAYIALTGETVDETTDLFDSYSFHLPFDQLGHCQRAGYDEATRTAVFLCTTETMDGRPIPKGGKMTFSLSRFLSGKEYAEDLAVDLDLADFTHDAATAKTWNVPSEETPEAFYRTGGSYASDEAESLYHSSPMLLPGDVLTKPVKELPITAAGYADGRFHVQLCRGDAAKTDNHGWMWLEDADGNRLEPLYTAGFMDTAARIDYTDYVFDVSPAELFHYTLHGDFHAASGLTEGPWRITFPLENS